MRAYLIAFFIFQIPAEFFSSLSKRFAAICEEVFESACASLVALNRGNKRGGKQHRTCVSTFSFVCLVIVAINWLRARDSRGLGPDFFFVTKR